MREYVSNLILVAVFGVFGTIPFVVPDCPPKLEIGQTYAQIKAGPCPDIEARANERAGNIVSYYCPSLGVQVLGDVTTGRMIGFIKIDYVPGEGR